MRTYEVRATFRVETTLSEDEAHAAVTRAMPDMESDLWVEFNPYVDGTRKYGGEVDLLDWDWDVTP